MNKEIGDLRNRIFLLEEQLSSYSALPQWDLTVGQNIVFESLRTDQIASLETISLAMELAGYGTSSYASIRTHMSLLRKKLKAHNAPYQVKSHSRIGWSLELKETP